MESGYKSMKGNLFVSDEEAFAYAMMEIPKGGQSLREEFVDWFFSGDWVREEKE